MECAGIDGLACADFKAGRAQTEIRDVDAVVEAAGLCERRDTPAAGRHAEQFPVDVFQTGSGTSSNMNVNEVLAHLAARSLARDVHPNDHVNMGQSSNDVVPSAIHVAAMLALRERLLPALQHLAQGIGLRESALGDAVKTGRTHLMDAMPLTLGQELSGWRSQIEQCGERLRSCEPRLLALAIGGTAVGTGINADPRFAAACCAQLAQLTGLAFVPGANRFAALASQDAAVELSGQLKVAAVALMKIANDLRWMNSGPLAGLGEIFERSGVTRSYWRQGDNLPVNQLDPVVLLEDPNFGHAVILFHRKAVMRERDGHDSTSCSVCRRDCTSDRNPQLRLSPSRRRLHGQRRVMTAHLAQSIEPPGEQALSVTH